MSSTVTMKIKAYSYETLTEMSDQCLYSAANNTSL